MLPESFCTINLHLLCHLSEQLKHTGPMYNSTMFTFESSMKKYKSLCHGSTSFDKQIVEGFLLYKYSYFEIFGNPNKYSRYNSVLYDKHDHSNVLNCTLMDEWRYVKGGIIYHCIQYPKKMSSQSFLCFTSAGQFCEIISFSKSFSGVIATVRVFKTVSILKVFSNVFSSNNVELYSLLTEAEVLLPCSAFSVIDNLVFDVIDVDASTLGPRAIRFDIPIFDISYTIVTYLIETGEHQ